MHKTDFYVKYDFIQWWQLYTNQIELLSGFPPGGSISPSRKTQSLSKLCVGKISPYNWYSLESEHLGPHPGMIIGGGLDFFDDLR